MIRCLLRADLLMWIQWQRPEIRGFRRDNLYILHSILCPVHPLATTSHGIFHRILRNIQKIQWIQIGGTVEVYQIHELVAFRFLGNI